MRLPSLLKRQTSPLHAAAIIPPIGRNRNMAYVFFIPQQLVVFLSNPLAGTNKTNISKVRGKRSFTLFPLLSSR